MTKTRPVTSIHPDNMDETSVMDYLKKHPQCLDRHPDILTELTLSHDSGSAVSLLERQIQVLRDHNRQLKNQLAELIHIARENEELSQRFHRLSLELMAGEHLHDIIAMTHEQIETFFYTDYVGFCFNDELANQLKGQEKNILDRASEQAACIKQWMHDRKPVFGPFDPGLQQLLFGEHSPLASYVLVPLYHANDFGLLILGSKSHDRFVEGMGTVFLNQLGELISAKLKHYLE